jgi:hypothetical protein
MRIDKRRAYRRKGDGGSQGLLTPDCKMPERDQCDKERGCLPKQVIGGGDESYMTTYQIAENTTYKVVRLV